MTRAAALHAPLQVRWKVAALALVFYVAFLVATAPATVLAWALAAIGTAVLESPEGSIWRGHASAVVIADASGSVRRYQRLSWKWSGLSPGLQLQIEAPGLRGAGRVSFTVDGIRLEDIAVRMPASAVVEYIPALSRVGLSGEFSFASKRLIWDGTNLKGVATIDWHDAASMLYDVNPLGDYRAHIVKMGTQIDFSVETLGGALRVRGRGSWSETGRLSFEGTAHADGASRAALADLLRALGPDRGGAVHQVKFEKIE